MVKIIGAIDRLTDALGRSIAWLTVLMTAVTVVVVVLRYAFDTGAIVLQEGVVYMHAMVFMLGIGYTLKVGGHVRVDLFYSRLSPVGQRRVDVAGHLLLLLPTTLFIAINSIDFVAASWRIREASPEVGGIPGVFLLKTLIPTMAVLLLLQGCAETLRALLARPSTTSTPLK